MTRDDLFGNILCPVDFSDHSRQALRYAALLARRNQARLSAIFVEDPLLAAAGAGTTAIASTRAELKRFVEHSVAPYGIDHGSLTFQTSIGKPFKEIIKAAAQSRADLIVIGAHGVTGASKMMIGSTTEHLLRHAKLPVLAIPPSRDHFSLVPSRGWPEKRALAPVELWRHLRSDGGAAAAVAKSLGGLLVLLHVVPRGNRKRLLRARATLQALLNTLKLDGVAASRALAGRPGDQIVAAASDADVDLVILTRRRGKGFFGAQIGSISYRVLCEAETPVLALPDTRTWLRRVRRASHDSARVAS